MWPSASKTSACLQKRRRRPTVYLRGFLRGDASLRGAAPNSCDAGVEKTRGQRGHLASTRALLGEVGCFQRFQPFWVRSARSSP